MTFNRAPLACLAALALIAGATETARANEPEGAKWTSWFELGGYYNSDDASRGELTVFAPITQGNHSLLFTDIRGKFFEEDVMEGSLALGYRQMMMSGFNLGAWIGGDVRNTEIDNTFWQLSGGFEALSHNYDARLNWYGPISDPQAGGEGFTEVLLRGNNILMLGGEEVGLYGIDGELGVRLPLELLSINASNIDLRVYGGGFYFDHEDAREEIAGGKARAELRINGILPFAPGSRLTAEYEFSYDDVREERHEVGARFRIPLDGGNGTRVAHLNAQEMRMMDGLERDTDIITTQSEKENVEDAITNVDFDRVAFVNNGGSISGTSNSAGANSLLIVNGTIQGAQLVNGNQTVQGGGSTIQVRGRKSGTVVGFTAPGRKPTVTTGVGNVITLQGSNTHIAGLLIDGQGTNNDGINGTDDKQNIAITQNMIRNIGDDGIDFNDNNRKISIADNMITGTGDNAITFEDENTDVTISDNTINGAGDDGITFDDDNSNVSVTGNTVTNVSNQGIALFFGNRNVVVADNAISNIGGTGILFFVDNSNITIRNNTLSDIGFIGIDMFAVSNNTTITGNTISNVADTGIQFLDFHTNAVVTNNTITNTGFDGISFEDNNSNIVVADNTISNVTEDAISFDDFNAGLTITRNTIVSPDDDAFRFGDNNTGIVITNNAVTGIVGDDWVDFNGAGNQILDGSGNSAIGATIGDEICEGDGNFTGNLIVDGIVYNDAANNCS